MFKTVKKAYKSEKNNTVKTINKAREELNSLNFDELGKLAMILNKLEKKTGMTFKAEITAERIALAADWASAKNDYEKTMDEVNAANFLK